MDVRCERCSTEYELDDATLTPEGVTVKCSNCGSIFKVLRRKDGAAVEEARAPEGQLFLVRNPRSGESYRFRDLTVLQQWIVERRVNREYELGGPGEVWRPLGTITELLPFF